MWSLQKRVWHGEKFPWGYGVAWSADFGHCAVCYPVPFNVVARWIRDAYFLLICPDGWEWVKAEELGNQMSREYGAGVEKGKQLCDQNFESSIAKLSLQPRDVVVVG